MQNLLKTVYSFSDAEAEHIWREVQGIHHYIYTNNLGTGLYTYFGDNPFEILLDRDTWVIPLCENLVRNVVTNIAMPVFVLNNELEHPILVTPRNVDEVFTDLRSVAHG